MGRANGQMGFVLINDQNAARRVVAMPEDATAVNRMTVLGAPALGIPDYSETKLRLRQLTHLAATHFDGTKSFWRQEWDTIAGGIVYLELHEPRLAVCERSWGACALLSKLSNNRAEHHTKMMAKRAAAAQSQVSEPVAHLPPSVALPPPPPPPTMQSAPALPAGHRGIAGGRPTGVGPSTGPQSAAQFFALNT